MDAQTGYATINTLSLSFYTRHAHRSYVASFNSLPFYTRRHEKRQGSTPRTPFMATPEID